jgi:hypothetical protein
LANLIFFDYEPHLVAKFLENGILYTRFVDDISVSSKNKISGKEKTEVIANIYGMLLHHNFKAKRSKHEISTSGHRMQTTKLVNNRRASLAPELRQNVRAAVFDLENRAKAGERGLEITRNLSSVAARVGRLRSYHPTEGAKLRTRLKTIRELLVEGYVHPSTKQSNINTESSDPIDPPWDS